MIQLKNHIGNCIESTPEDAGKMFIIFLIALLPLIASAQRDSGSVRRGAGFGIEVNVLGGKVFKHEEKFTLPIPSLTSGLDVNFLQYTYGRNEWEQRRHYPRLGVALMAIDYGINSVYGQMVGVYPNLTFPFITGNKLDCALRIGNGIGFVSRRFSRTDPVNTVNVAIGSKLNDLIMIRTDLSYRWNSHLDIRAGAFVTHISNGSVRKPNLGVNVAGLSAGICYYPVAARHVRYTAALSPIPGRYLFHLRYGMSLVSAYTAGGPLYPVYIGTAYISRRWRGHNKIFAGADYSYHENIYAHLRNNGLEPGREAQHSYKSALIAGNEFLLGRVGIMLQAGVYIKKSALQKEDVYEKVSFNYYLVQHEWGAVKEFFIFTSLKAHLNVAEMGEMGIGVGFGGKKKSAKAMP